MGACTGSEDGVDDTEDSAVDADAEGERDDRDEGEAARLGQTADGKPHVLGEGLHGPNIRPWPKGGFARL